MIVGIHKGFWNSHKLAKWILGLRNGFTHPFGFRKVALGLQNFCMPCKIFAGCANRFL